MSRFAAVVDTPSTAPSSATQNSATVGHPCPAMGSSCSHPRAVNAAAEWIDSGGCRSAHAAASSRRSAAARSSVAFRARTTVRIPDASRSSTSGRLVEERRSWVVVMGTSQPEPTDSLACEKASVEKYFRTREPWEGSRLAAAWAGVPGEAAPGSARHPRRAPRPASPASGTSRDLHRQGAPRRSRGRGARRSHPPPRRKDRRPAAIPRPCRLRCSSKRGPSLLASAAARASAAAMTSDSALMWRSPAATPPAQPRTPRPVSASPSRPRRHRRTHA